MSMSLKQLRPDGPIFIVLPLYFKGGLTTIVNILAQVEKHMSSSTDSTSMDLSEWESVTMDRTQWTMAVRQLEDLLELQCLLKMKPANRSPGAIATGEIEPISVSVKKVQDGGRGINGLFDRVEFVCCFFSKFQLNCN